jgi:competence protein ComEA
MQFKHIREYFIFTRKERNGLLILVLILILTLLLDFSIPFLVPERKYDVTTWKQEAEKYYAAVPLVKGEELVTLKGVIDPNNVGETALLQLGMPPKLASNWVKYLQKGGRFRTKEDVKKLYGMTVERYGKVEGYLMIPEKRGIQKIKIDEGKEGRKYSNSAQKDTLLHDSHQEKKLLAMVELNQADSIGLESLPGIGPVLASRIIKYRNLLGGYYEVAQLKEIYGMTEELWSKCSPRLSADPSGVMKLKINFLSTVELGRHPYIGFRQAKKIAKIRDASGKFRQNEELSAFFSTDSLRRLVPYLSYSGGGQ